MMVRAEVPAAEEAVGGGIRRQDLGQRNQGPRHYWSGSQDACYDVFVHFGYRCVYMLHSAFHIVYLPVGSPLLINFRVTCRRQG